MDIKKVLLVIAAVVAIAIVVILVQSGTQNPTLEGEPTGTNNNQQQPDRTIQVQGDEYSFAPSQITANKGELVRFEFTNVGQFPHDFKIRNQENRLLGGTKIISPGETDSFLLQMPNEPTEIQFSSFCSVPGHEEQGMVGTLIVE